MKEVALSPPAEEAWQTLRHQLDWADHWWVGWVYSDHAPTLGELRRRLEGVRTGPDRAVRAWTIRSPGDVEAVLDDLVRPGAGVAWVQLDATSADAAEAWKVLHARLNERRERLRRAGPKALILAGSGRWKAEVAAQAPDLWSVRSLAIEAPGAPVREVFLSWDAWTFASTAEGLDPDLAEAAAGRVEAALARAVEAGAPPEELARRRRESAEVALRASTALREVRRPDRALPLAQRALARLTAGSLVDEALCAAALTELGHGRWGLRDLPGAVGAFTESVDVVRGVRARRGDLPDVLRDLSVALNNLGNARRGLGELEPARLAFDESLDLRRMLRARLGDQPQVMRDLSVSLNNVGNVQRGLGDVGAALAAFSESLEVRRALRMQLGEEVHLLRDLAVSLECVGSVRQDLAEFVAAHAAVAESLDLRRALRERLGDQPNVIRDLSFTLVQGGGVLACLGDLEGAREAFAESLVLRRGLRVTLGDQPQVLHELAVAATALHSLTESPRERAALAAEALGAVEAYAAKTEDPGTAELLAWVRADAAREAPVVPLPRDVPPDP